MPNINIEMYRCQLYVSSNEVHLVFNKSLSVKNNAATTKNLTLSDFTVSFYIFVTKTISNGFI
jgi:hypothetical protein